VTALVIGAVSAIAVFALFIAGVTFFGLAIAFPIAVPVAQAYQLPISAADAALAERFAGFWWASLGLAVASFFAAAVVAIKVVDVLSRASRD
jgi:hypothetical protein